MNKDDDPRFVENGDWIDALNCATYNGDGVGGDIVTEIGNSEIPTYLSGNTEYTLPSGTNTCIGSVDDPIRKHTYYFVHNSNGNHTILRYEYDLNIARLVIEDNDFSLFSPFSHTTNYSPPVTVTSGGEAYSLFRANYLSRKTTTSYNNSTNVITVGTHYYKTGDMITFYENGGAIGGLTDEDVYYAIRTSSTEIQVALSFSDAINGVEVSLSSTLSGSPYFEYTNGVLDKSAWYKFSDRLNFSLSNKIHSAAVIEQSSKVYLVWTDNQEQPSVLDVTTIPSIPRSRAMVDLYATQPQHPMTAEYGSDSITNNNNTAKKALQFRYSYKLNDNRTTVMSPISRIPIPTVANYSSIRQDNKVQLQVPLDERLSISEVNIYVKVNGSGNSGDWYLADVVKVSGATVLENSSPFSDRYLRYIAYDFFNESVLAPVQQEIQQQLQDRIPRASKALCVASDRVLLANNLDGYDFNLSTLDVIVEPVTTVKDLASGAAPLPTFKKACKYPIGIVYGDRNGRVSTVYTNKDMFLEVPYWAYWNRGQVKCKISIGHAPPSWAEFWYPVFSGNQTMSSWTQSVVDSVSTNRFTLSDVDSYNAENDDAGYDISFLKGQQTRVIYDSSAVDFMAATNGDVRVAGISPSYQVKAAFNQFTTNPANNDLMEVYRPKTADEIDTAIWYEMGWSFKIEIDKNGNRVHGGNSSFYSLSDSYSAAEYTVTAVNTTTDQITIGAHNYTTGDAILYRDGGTAITPLVDNTVYYVIVVSPSTIQLATTKANALAGADINLTATTTFGQLIQGDNAPVKTQSQIIGADSQDCIVVVDQADCYLRNILDLDSSSPTVYKTYEFQDIFPFEDSKVRGIGRANIYNESYKETRIEEDISFSEKVVNDTDFIGFNRFLDANFSSSVSNSFGGINFMFAEGDSVLCLQETRTSRLLANRNYVYTTQGSLEIQANTFLSEPKYFTQEFGCQNPESFAQYSGVKFWVDRFRGAVVRCVGNSLENIGQIKMSSYFERNLPDTLASSQGFGNKGFVYGGYSFRDNCYYINLDTHRITKRVFTSDSFEYIVQMTDLDMEDGTFDQIIADGGFFVGYNNVVGVGFIPWLEVSVITSSSANKTITVGNGTSFASGTSFIIYLPKVETLSFSNERNRWISRHSFNPEWIGESGNSLISFKSGKMYKHYLSSYETDFFTTQFNYARFYGVGYNMLIETPFNQDNNVVKTPLNIMTDSNQVFYVEYAHNERGQITENVLADFVSKEGGYWAVMFRDKTTPNLTYPLLEGDLMKGRVLRCILETVVDGNQQSSLSVAELVYNQSKTI